ncbi:MAG: YicC/YloC family endoribonuclease [Bacillota bacterium]|nr:YicC/YloC family endoribonuclease [Bacillota bacterium]
MIKSMTGYGRVSKLINGKEIMVEIKSVNHRYFDFTAKVPRIYGYLEDKVKGLVSQSVNRGKVDVFITINTVGGPDMEVVLNDSLLRSYLAALHHISEEYGVTDDISVSSIARYTDIFNVTRREEDEDELWDEVQTVAEEALASFSHMRGVEGQKLHDDLISRAKYIENITHEIESASEKTAPEYKQRLETHIKELIDSAQIDETRLLTEVALFADRISITEEIVRLRSHLSQFYTMMEENVPIGRKIDFLIQEMNREINTVGSKASDIAVSRLVVDVKAELEKIREQVQNIE